MSDDDIIHISIVVDDPSKLTDIAVHWDMPVSDFFEQAQYQIIVED